MPIISKPPSGFTSATMAAILEVPTSRPTISFLLSRALLMRSSRPLTRSWPAFRRRLPATRLRQAHREAVGVTQVHVLHPRPERRERAIVHCDESREARLDLLAPEGERDPACEPHFPGAARGHLQPHRRLADRLQALAEIAVLDRHFPRCPFRSDELRQLALVGGPEHAALRVDERAGTPARERHVFLEHD